MRASFAVLGILGALLSSQTARADARTEARAYFKKGMAAISNGNYEGGIQELKRAYEALPHPNVLYNIARAYVEMGDLENAIAYYKQYIEAPNISDRDEVVSLVAQLQARVDKQRAALAAAQQRGPSGPPAGPTGPTGPTGPVTPGPGPTGPTGPVGPTGTEPGPGTEPPLPPVPKGPAGETKGTEIYEESVVTASRGGAQSPLESPSTVTIITEQDIRLSGHTKIGELLRRVAGVDNMAVSGGHNEVSFRGLNQRLSNKLLILVDGRSVYLDWFGGTFWDWLSINVDQIDRIEVVRGPGSALYGADAVTGVVNIITKAPGTGKNFFRGGYGDHGEAYGSLQATGRDKEFSYRASAGYLRRPRWSREVPDGRVDVQSFNPDQNLGSEWSKIDIRTQTRLGKNEVLGVGGGFAQGFLDFYTIGALKDYNLRSATGDVTAFVNTKKVNVRAFYNFARVDPLIYSHNYVSQTTLPSIVFSNVVDVEGVYADKFETGSLKHAVNVGANYRLRNTLSAYTNLNGQYNISEHHYGFFGQETLTVTKALQFVLGGRLDYVPYNKQFQASPRGAVLVHPTEKSTIRATVSSAFRKPTFLEGYVDVGVQPPTGAVESNTNTLALSGRIKPERILTAELAYLNQDSDKFDIEVVGYYNRVTDLILLVPNQFLTPNQRFTNGVDNGFNETDGRYIIGTSGFGNQCAAYNFFGGELGGRVYPLPGLDFFANYAINYTGIDRPAGCDIPSDRRTSAHKLNVGAQVRSKPGIDGEVILHFVSDQRWVERDLDPAVGAIVSKQLYLPAYAIVNARLGYRFLQNRAEVYGTAFNLLNNVHQEHPFGQFVGRRFMGFFTYTF